MVTKFSFSIGGYRGPRNCIKLVGNKLYYTHQYDDSSSISYEAQINDKDDWNKLVEFLSTKKWKGNYTYPDTLDGTQWSLQIVTDEFQINCEGSNKFPLGFKKFLRLLNDVIDDGPTIY